MRGIIAEQLGVEEDKVVPGASFTDDLGPRGGQRRRKRKKDSSKYSRAVGQGFPGVCLPGEITRYSFTQG